MSSSCAEPVLPLTRVPANETRTASEWWEMACRCLPFPGWALSVIISYYTTAKSALSPQPATSRVLILGIQDLPCPSYMVQPHRCMQIVFRKFD